MAPRAGSGDDPIDVESLVKGRHIGESKGKGNEDGKQSTTEGKGPRNQKFDGTWQV